MRVPDWSIQTSWWASGIFATGAVWYFLSTGKYGLAIAAAVAAALFAALAIMLHRKKDSLSLSVSFAHVPIEKDKMVTTEWWNASDLRKDYESRGLKSFRWSDAARVPEREQQAFVVVYLEDAVAKIRYRIVNKSGQVLIAKRDA